MAPETWAPDVTMVRPEPPELIFDRPISRVTQASGANDLTSTRPRHAEPPGP